MPGSTGYGYEADAVDAASVLADFGVADFDVDVATGAVRSRAGLGVLFGFPEAHALTREEFCARVHPDDAAGLSALVRAAAPAGARFEHEFRVLLPGGAVRWLYSRGEVDCSDGAPRRVRGACFDITDRKVSEQAARESEARYRALTELCPSAILVSCGDRCVYANDAAVRLLRAVSARELTGRSPFEFLDRDYHELARERFRRVLEQRGAVPRVRYRWRRLDGTPVDVDAAASWVQWQGEDAVQVVAHDITEEVLVEEALRESRARLAEELEDARRLHAISTKLIEAEGPDEVHRELLQAAMALTHADFGSLQELDPASGDLRLVVQHGFQPESAAFWSVVRQDGGAFDRTAVARQQRVLVEDIETCDFMAGTADHAEYRRSGIRAMQSTPLKARDGALLGVMSTHWRHPHRPSDRELQRMDIVARQAADLLERLRAARALRDSEARLSAVFDALPVGAGLMGTDGTYVLANRLMRTYLPSGVIPSRDERAYGRWRGHGSGGHRLDRSEYPGARALRGETVVPGIEMLHTRDDGREVWMRVAAAPLLGPDGRVTGAVGVVEDIDALKRTAEALRASEERYRRLFEQMDEGFSVADVVRDATGRVVDARWTQVNPAIERQTGLPAERFIGRLATEALPGLGDFWIDVYARVANTGRAERFEQYAEPLQRWYDITVFLYAPEQIAVLYDEITERKRIEAALRESEERHRLLVTSYAQAVWETDAEGRVVVDSPSWRAYTGQTTEEWLGNGWADAIHPDDRARAEEAWLGSVATGRNLDAEFRLRDARGGWRWTNVRATPLVDGAGRVVKWLGVNIDIDARRGVLA